MKNKRSAKQYTNPQGFSLLVAFDFSPYSIQALRAARSILGQKPGRIVVLHVIDRDFVEKCVRNRLAAESHIKETLFRQAKAKLQNFLRKEGMDGGEVEKVVCEGTPFIEINKKVGFRLLTKFGEKGVINLGKLVPIAGGIIGGSVDSISTWGVGVAARKTFVGTAPGDTPSEAGVVG